MLARRTLFIALAVATIAVGLLVRFGGEALLGWGVRDKLGDALWAMMIAWWIGALAPRARLMSRALAAYAICAAVEFSQAWHTPALDAIRATRLGQLVLGVGFEPRDFVAYALGVAAAALIEAAASRVTSRQSTGS